MKISLNLICLVLIITIYFAANAAENEINFRQDNVFIGRTKGMGELNAASVKAGDANGVSIKSDSNVPLLLLKDSKISTSKMFEGNDVDILGSIFFDGNKILENSGADLVVKNNAIISSQLKILGGSPGNGKLLQSDANGLASWETFSDADDLGNHIATQNIQLNNNYLSNDTNNYGLTVLPGGDVSFSNKVKILGGSPANGKVLTSDANGLAAWVIASDADNLGNHTAEQNIILGNYFLSRDGNDTGLSIDGNSVVTFTDSDSNVILKLKNDVIESSENIVIRSGKSVKLSDDDNSNTVSLKIPSSLSSDSTLTFPDGSGIIGQALVNKGSGVLEWKTAGESSNRITYSDFENGATTGYALYDDGNSVIVIDGINGNPNVISIAANPNYAISGQYDLQISKIAASAKGEGLSYDFSIERGEQGRIMRECFNYKTSTNYHDGDIRAFLIDRVSGEVINTANWDLMATSAYINKCFEFQTNYDSNDLAPRTNYRLAFHAIDADSNSWTINIDNMFFGYKTGQKNGSVTVGEIFAYAGSCPAGSSLTDGGTLSRTQYSELFAKIGTAYGYGDNSTTFHKPDLRGRFLRGRDGGAGRDSGGRTASNTGGATGDNVGSWQDDAFQGHGHYMLGGSGVISDYFGGSTAAYGTGRGSEDTTYRVGTPVDIGYGERFSYETRPDNVYVNYCIWYTSGTIMSEDAAQSAIYATGAGNAGQALTADTNDITFTTVLNPNGAWNGTQFTSPATGLYDFSGSVLLTTSITGAIESYVDGATPFRHGVSITGNLFTFSGSRYLLKGKILSFRSTISGTLSNTAQYHHMTISKDGDPSTIASTEKQFANLSNTVGTSTNGSNILVPWAMDESNYGPDAFTAGTYLKALRSGNGTVSSRLQNSTANIWLNMRIDVSKDGGSTWPKTICADSAQAASVSTSVGCEKTLSIVKNDLFRVMMSGAASTLTPSAGFNFFSIIIE